MAAQKPLYYADGAHYRCGVCDEVIPDGALIHTPDGFDRAGKPKVLLVEMPDPATDEMNVVHRHG